MLYVTTSWDDGSVHDKRLALLLEQYGIRGTFYVCKEYPAVGPLLTETDIAKLSATHEIGAHTLTHPDLPTVASEVLQQEIAGSKKWLEGVIGKDVELFCYPSGRYSAAAVQAVQEAGFLGARTVQWPTIRHSPNLFEMATTLPVYPLPFRKLAGGRLWWRKLLQPLFERYARLRTLGVPLWRMYSWESAARAAFDHALAHGSVFHLWGHSWEIENYGLWEELEQVLAYMASKQGVQFVTNGELVRIGWENILLLGGEASWVIVPKGINEHSVVYSFGAGMDISWDLALIKHYGLTVHAFDPSQKSIDWLAAQQLPKQFVFYPYGASDHDGTESFYPPPNPKNVSYSTVRKVGAPVALPVKRLETIMQELGHTHLDILKLDIEGGEYTVIDDMLKSNILPTQLLLEFHDRFVGKQKKSQTLKKLRERGYVVLFESQSGEEYTLQRA